jgi:hypothetical protein
VAKWWREPLDPAKHRDHFSSGQWTTPSRPADRLIPAWVYFVEVCGFTFEFVSLAQLRECLRYYERKLFPSSRQPVFAPESGEWLHWYERLPLYLREEPKRQKVVTALSRAVEAFATEAD